MRAVAYWTRPTRGGWATRCRRGRPSDAARDQAAGGGVDLLPQLAVGRAVALLADDERLAVAEAFDDPRRSAPIVSSTRGRSRGPAECESGKVVGSRSMSMSGEDAPGAPRFPPSQRTLGSPPAKPRAARRPCGHVFTESSQSRRDRRSHRPARRGRGLRRRRGHVLAGRPGRLRSGASPAAVGCPRSRRLRAGQGARRLDRRAAEGHAGGAAPDSAEPRRAGCERSGRCAGQGARPVGGQGQGGDAGHAPERWAAGGAAPPSSSSGTSSS